MKPILFQCKPRGCGVEALIAAKGQNCVWINEILSDGPQRIDCKPSMVRSRRVLPPCALSKHQGSDGRRRLICSIYYDEVAAPLWWDDLFSPRIQVKLGFLWHVSHDHPPTNPPPSSCLPPSLLSKIHLTSSLPSFPELFFQTCSQHKITNLEPKPCLLILAFLFWQLSHCLLSVHLPNGGQNHLCGACKTKWFIHKQVECLLYTTYAGWMNNIQDSKTLFWLKTKKQHIG